MQFDRKLILEDGSEFYGFGFGAGTDAVCEIVFNTSVAGYQEILSDPSYTDQGVVMSYPLIGSYGINSEDYESRCVTPAALIVRDINGSPSNFRSTGTVEELLSDSGIPGLCGVDTRKLVRSIRDLGSRRGLITDARVPAEKGMEIIAAAPVRHDAVRRQSCRKKWYSRTSNPRHQVVVIDCGLKMNIIRMLNREKCNVTVVPFDTPADEILRLTPDGVVVSNGPGDPEDVPEVIETLKGLRGELPVMGICLGHQLTALSFGAKTYKLKFGHRGGNHPVKDLRTGRIEITSQNHSYAVDVDTVSGTGLEVTHVNLLDGTVEGLGSEKNRILTVQYHPESCPGPQDSTYLFKQFTAMLGH